MSAMTGVEVVLWVVLTILFRKKRLQRRFPTVGWYFLLRAVSTPVLLICFYLNLSDPDHLRFYSVYFAAYWSVYLVSTVLLFFISIEIFRSALVAFPGLTRIGVVIFRWAVVVSILVTFSSISYSHIGLMLIPGLLTDLMRAVAVLELCLLGFLCLSMNALRLSIRDMAFGVALGLGLFSVNDFVFAALSSVLHTEPLSAPLQAAYQALILVTISVWITYTLLPAPAPRPVILPINSTIYRWNEIASALGHTGTQVAPQQAESNSFFLSDVEKVVEKVLNKNLKGHESES